MNRAEILAKDHWRFFDSVDGLDDLELVALACMDSFLDHVTDHGLVTPSSDDIQDWAMQQDEPISAGQHLLVALAICVPPFADAARNAVAALKNAKLPRGPKRVPEQDEAPQDASSGAVGYWDPLARPAPAYSGRRKVSVYPEELPEPWKAGLVRAAIGQPGNGVIYSRAILRRTRDKLCQLAWSCRRAGWPVEISQSTADRFQRDLVERCRAGKNGLRWSTVRAALEELHRFSRFMGYNDELIGFLGERRALLERRERRQKALKHFELARTGNTTNRILDMADGLLSATGATTCARKRHRMRNAACILGVYPIAPLRNASAYLMFGKNLFWSNNEWVIEIKIQKTQAATPYHFVLPLHRDHGKFIDAVLLGDEDRQRLSKLRADATKKLRPLFVLQDGRPAAPTYIPRIFKAMTGNSFTTTRTMLHTDEAIENGDAGTSYAMASCHQVDWEVRRKYQLDTLARSSVERRQQAGRNRRAAYFDIAAPQSHKV